MNGNEKGESCVEWITCVPHPNTLTATGEQSYRDSDKGKKALPFVIAEKIVRLPTPNISFLSLCGSEI
jgi:hypothetical protein